MSYKNKVRILSLIALVAVSACEVPKEAVSALNAPNSPSPFPATEDFEASIRNQITASGLNVAEGDRTPANAVALMDFVTTHNPANSDMGGIGGYAVETVAAALKNMLLGHGYGLASFNDLTQFTAFVLISYGYHVRVTELYTVANSMQYGLEVETTAGYIALSAYFNSAFKDAGGDYLSFSDMVAGAPYTIETLHNPANDNILTHSPAFGTYLHSVQYQGI